jgi:hypothetical protein
MPILLLAVTMRTNGPDTRSFPDNTALEDAMAHFCAITDDREPYALTRLLFASSLLVPLAFDTTEPDDVRFTTVEELNGGPVLHVFTALDRIPSGLSGHNRIEVFPFAELMETCEEQEVVALLIDGQHGHGVLALVDGHHLYAYERLKQRTPPVAKG